MSGARRRPRRQKSFAVIAGTTSNNSSSSGTSRSVSLPASIVAKDLLIIVLCCNGNVASAAATGWNLVAEATDFASISQIVMWRYADGSEGASVTVTLGASASASAHVAYRITGASKNGPQGTKSTGSSNAPNPAAITPSWGLEKVLWLCGLSKVASGSINSYPANYTLNQLSDVSGTTRVAIAGYQALAATEDPATFSLSASIGWATFTLAVAPS